MPNRGEFRATTDQLLDIIDELRRLEKSKQSTALGSPEFVELAVKAADQAKLTFRWCQMQLEMAHEAAARLQSGQETPNVHLIMVTPRAIDRILLEIARPGSAEAMSAADDIERLREEYQVAHQVVRQES
jgi:hypothetical protein